MGGESLVDFSGSGYWAVILGGSSGFGLATAKKLSRCGMNICIVHRDRRGSMQRIEAEFESIRRTGVSFCALNLDALSAEGREKTLEELKSQLGKGASSNSQKVRLLLHSIAFGSVKLAAPMIEKSSQTIKTLAAKLKVEPSLLQKAIDETFSDQNPELASVATPTKYESELLLEEEDISQTIYAMGTSLLSWTRALHASKLFANDARVIGLTSEGNEVAWRGYAAVSAAKSALEAVSRSIAVEFAPFGIRSNIVQPGVTDTPALRHIPGNAHLSAAALLKNPFGRLTEPEDVANVIALLASDEASWINGSIVRVDGGERIAG